ncbi:hypothetical protein CLV59_1011002 [Chitinophaga dinghuensis]|uniref:Uncharacterized protein n=1 Tax=Chitinophaga dinghuensis TaxID=1539050 RepID=A0A327WKB6_9BACT|nr:hypothetical protein [Chitinophaga dinghuensis]RAJ88234.1 hypothetical protein CLV59_1011002 [Chitinophaga dinghuensis]
MLSLIIEDCVNLDDLLVSLSHYFKETVSIAYLDIDSELSEDIDVVLECVPMKGDVCWEVCIYSHLKLDIKELSVYLCRYFKTRIIIGDDQINPFTWILITATGKEQSVEQIPNDEGLFLFKR